MRFTVTPAAKRNLFVGRMAVGARDGCVLCHLLLKHVHDVIVAASTDGRWRIHTIRYLCGFMDRMAGHALCSGKLYLWAVGFMAYAALWDVTVPVGVAVCADYFGRMSTRILLYFIAFF